MLLSHPARRRVAAASVLAAFLLIPGFAQEAAPAPDASSDSAADLRRQAAELRAMLETLEKRIDRLENASHPAEPGAAPAQAAQPEVSQAPPPSAPASGGAAGLLAGTTVNLLLDTYYEYNFNSPIGRANLLRAYDVSSNSFSLNQAAVIIESAPKPEDGKLWGVRLDLQFGQATQTLQGNPVNEPRPDIYRNIFQAYGTYVIPVGRGLTVDFGKWASSLGLENNYTKDQINYSRSLWFDFLPFYHMGARASYNFSDQFGVHYWITNGTDQTEAFNGFKDESFGFTWQPRKSINWNVNYYLGQEHPDVVYFPYGPPANLGNLPTQQGVPFDPVPSPPTGKLHIFDSYATWQPSPALTLAAEADWVIERNFSYSAPAHADGGALYARYQLTPKVAVAGRAEYLSDRGGLFSGVTQALKETTFTADYKLADAFLLRWEYRRDFSNRPFFYTDTLGILKRSQTTAGLGVVWWFGGKEGPW